MNKKERVERVLDVFEQMYPDATCELNYTTIFELLIAVMLSAQTTDASVNKLTVDLFEKYKTVDDYADAPIKELQNDLRRIGLYKTKAQNVKAMANRIRDDYQGEVPCNHEILVSLPGVGRKTANVVMSEGFKVPAIAVDTHVERVSKRLKLAYNNDTVLEVEKKLMKCLDRDVWSKTHHQMIFFGRYHCKSLNPNCGECTLIDICREPKRKKFI